MQAGTLTLLAHIATALAAIVCVTVLAALGKVPGDNAILVIVGVAGIAAPALGRPSNPTPNTTTSSAP